MSSHGTGTLPIGALGRSLIVVLDPTENSAITEEGDVILTTTRIEDFDRFLETFSTRGAEKRKQHGCKGSTVFRDPNEDDRIWVVFEWDEHGFDAFLSDPEVPALFQAAGLKERPQATPVVNRFDT